MRVRRIPGPISSDRGEEDSESKELGEAAPRQGLNTLFQMNSWLELCATVGVDTATSRGMKESIEEIMPCTIQSILASDDLRVTRLLAMVQTSHLSHAGVWILTLVDCTGEHIDAMVDQTTLASHDGMGKCGTALLLENVALYLERSTLERYLNLHRMCITAVYPNERNEKVGASTSEDFLGI